MSTIDPAPSTRRAGRPLRIDRDRIVDVAKRLDPATMTMKAVADELGVDRKALNYHVTDREGLLRLVAADVFEANFAQSFRSHLAAQEDHSSGNWRGAVRSWAGAVRDGVLVAGVLANYYRVGADNLAIFEPVEHVLQSMLAAGFDHLTASRGLVSITRIAMSIGRDIVMERELGHHPQEPELHRVLDGATDETGYEAIRDLVSANLNVGDDALVQFDFEVELFLDGMGTRLLH